MRGMCHKRTAGTGNSKYLLGEADVHGHQNPKEPLPAIQGICRVSSTSGKCLGAYVCDQSGLCAHKSIPKPLVFNTTACGVT